MKRIAWTEQAKAAATRIPYALHRFAESGTGDIKAFRGGVNPGCLRPVPSL